MRLGRCFIARAAIAKIMPVQYARFFKQANRPIYGGNRDFGINGRRTAVKFLHIGVVIRIGNDARDDAPLIGYAQAPFVTERLNVNFAIHWTRHLVPPDDSSKKKAGDVPALYSCRSAKSLSHFLLAARTRRATKANGLSQFAALLGISGGDHWIIGGQSPLRAIIIRCHAIMRHKVTLEHF